jgi:Sulfotransferase domain
LPVFRSNKALDIARDVKAFLSGKATKRQEYKRVRNEITNKKQERRRKRQELHNKKQEYKQIKSDVRAATGRVEKTEHKERVRRIKEEISRLESELHAAEEQQAEGAPDGRTAARVAGESQTGALPDFVVIGGKKCGTTSFYYLLTQHPLVEPAASKELHFFDIVFDEGIEWYRRCFPQPTWEDGRRTITGEGTPYMAHRLAPERMAQVIPQVRLIALLRNPVDRAYSDYQMAVRKEREPKTFEEAIGLDEGAMGAGQARLLDDDSEYLSRGLYVDQLLRWSRFFSREQMLVLKSEDFFERPKETLKVVLKFLDLPEWEPKASETGMERKKRDKRNPGAYEGGMEAATRRRLEEYFEPHNKRLYDYLGTDFGW